MRNIIKILGVLCLIIFSFSFYKTKGLSLNTKILMSDTQTFDANKESLRAKAPTRPRLSNSSTKRGRLLDKIKLEQYEEDLADYKESLTILEKDPVSPMKTLTTKFDHILDWELTMNVSGVICGIYLIVFLYRFFFQ